MPAFASMTKAVATFGDLLTGVKHGVFFVAAIDRRFRQRIEIHISDLSRAARKAVAAESTVEVS